MEDLQVMKQEQQMQQGTPNSYYNDDDQDHHDEDVTPGVIVTGDNNGPNVEGYHGEDDLDYEESYNQDDYDDAIVDNDLDSNDEGALEDTADAGDNNNSTNPPKNQQVPTQQQQIDAMVKCENAAMQTSLWSLPVDKDSCTLEEIRRGQALNGKAPNECPVPGCGKKINEMRAEPPPGSISSGLRTHVLFVHYGNRKTTKKKKLGWSNKRRGQPSPKKQPSMSSQSSSVKSPMLEFDRLDGQPEHAQAQQNSSVSNINNIGLNLMRKVNASRSSNQGATSLIQKKPKLTNSVTSSSKQPQPYSISSLQSLIQATSGSQQQAQSSNSAQNNQKNDDIQKNFNQTTSSLFSILAGLTQQSGQQFQQSQTPRRTGQASNQGTNTINISQCSRNNKPVNSSLSSLLNEHISGNVASSLQNLKKTLGSDQRSKQSQATQRQRLSPPSANPFLMPKNANHTSQNGMANFSNGTSLLSSICASNGENRSSADITSSMNSFIESIAMKTGSVIGPVGIAEVRKMIEKFTNSLLLNSQTIADHYVAPFSNEEVQNKPEINPSDILLAYKMMFKFHP